MRPARTIGALLAAAIATGAVAAPVLTMHPPDRYFKGYENAPPMLPHLLDEGRPSRPFIRPVTLVNPLERRYAELPDAMPIQFLRGGTVFSIDESRGPWFPLGTDPLGRDVFARLLYGARLSLAVSLLAAAGALLLGTLIGAPAGFLGGRAESVLMTLADFVLVLPAIYVVLVLRASLPAVLSVAQIFWILVLVLAAAGWPLAARGVRGIIAAERHREYAEAAYAAGASPLRILLHHLLPATAPFLLVTGTLMVPAFLLTEGTMTLVGMGFPVGTASWGGMLRDAWQGGALTDAPWLLAPAAMIVLTVLSLQLLTASDRGDLPKAGTFS